MLAYHVESAAPVEKHQLAPGHLLIEKRGLGHLWSTRLCAATEAAPRSTAAQTREVFGELIGALEGRGATLADNCVRTWIYVKDVDVFYQDMVAARSDLFAEHGLTRRDAFPRQHRHRGRLRAPLRHRADGRLFHPRAASRSRFRI